MRMEERDERVTSAPRHMVVSSWGVVDSSWLDLLLEDDSGSNDTYRHFISPAS